MRLENEAGVLAICLRQWVHHHHFQDHEYRYRYDKVIITASRFVVVVVERHGHVSYSLTLFRLKVVLLRA